jgi:hypothetical protein
MIALPAILAAEARALNRRRRAEETRGTSASGRNAFVQEPRGEGASPPKATETGVLAIRDFDRLGGSVGARLRPRPARADRPRSSSSSALSLDRLPLTTVFRGSSTAFDRRRLPMGPPDGRWGRTRVLPSGRWLPAGPWKPAPRL